MPEGSVKPATLAQQVPRPQGRRARRRRDGRADRRAPRQRQRAADPLRARRRGQGQERQREEGARQPRQARAQPARHQGGARADRPRQLRRAPGAAGRVRPRDRGDQRAHGLEEGALREGRAAHRAERDLRLQHLGPVDHRDGEDAARGRCASASAASTSSTRRATCGWWSWSPRPTPIPRCSTALETFLTTTLGKGVIRAKDTPNFIANRVGVFSMLATMHHTKQFNLGFDEVDALTGPAIGRAQERHLPHRRRGGPGHDGPRREDDGRHAARRSVGARSTRRPSGSPSWSPRARSARRPRPGIYTKKGKDILVLDVGEAGLPRLGRRRGRRGAGDPQGEESRRAAREAARLGATRRGSSCGRSSATCSTTPPCTWRTSRIRARDVDFAIRWGFGWSRGPFELWQAAGWKRVAAGSRRTSPRARPWRRRRCRSG